MRRFACGMGLLRQVVFGLRSGAFELKPGRLLPGPRTVPNHATTIGAQSSGVLSASCDSIRPRPIIHRVSTRADMKDFDNRGDGEIGKRETARSHKYS